MSGSQLISVSLEPNDWQIVWAALRKMPFEAVEQVLPRLVQQVNAATQAQMQRRANGEDQEVIDERA